MFTTDIGTDTARAKHYLEHGELVAIPTETVYGLAANGLDASAVASIYRVKNRPQFNPLILHVANEVQFSKWAKQIPSHCRALIKAFTPGPITFLLDKSEQVPDLVTAGSKRVALRIPDHALTLGLLAQLEFPLAAPSANPSGYVSPVTALHVKEGLDGKIPYILDGGTCKVGLESTIVSFDNNLIRIHRLGGISEKDIQHATGANTELSLAHDQPESPGQLKSHYATSTPLLVGDISQMLTQHHGKRIGVISFYRDYSQVSTVNYVLSPQGDVTEAASSLFSAMRELDRSQLDIILAESFPDEGLGKAINDRLNRAAFSAQ